jgi:hypothetical protein
MLSIYLTTIFLTTRYDSTRPRFAASSASLFAALQEVTSWETNGGKMEQLDGNGDIMGI